MPSLLSKKACKPNSKALAKRHIDVTLSARTIKTLSTYVERAVVVFGVR